MRLSRIGRVLAIGAVIGAVVLVAIVLFGPGKGDSYEVTARFINGGQLVKGNPVQSGGVPIGTVKGIEITEDGQADISFTIKEKYAPLREGSRATIRQFSQSGIANRYIDITYPPNGSEEIADGGRIEIDSTKTAVDLDELFNTIDPKTRKSLQKFFKGSAAQFSGRGKQANVGLQYLNPSLATTSRLFNELTRDQRVLERFLVDSSRLVTTIAERRDDLAALIGNANSTTRALGNQKAALAESIDKLPPFMRRANTTFVNLRAALNDVDPLVDASKPVARRLGPFLNESRAFATDAVPTVRDLSRTIRRRGRDNDLINLLDALPRLNEIATVTKQRTAAPGGRKYSVGNTRGSFQETTAAFKSAGPEIAFARPYTPDFVGWFDDFSTTGAGLDVYGGTARGQLQFTPLLFGAGSGGHFRRCPGSAEAPAADGSNVLSQAEQDQLGCRESDRGVR